MNVDDEAAVRRLVSNLHEHLEATEERPVERTASAYLGEAAAVAADVAEDPDVSMAVVETRVGHVADLLSNVEETGDEAADDHAAAASDLAEEILDRLDARGDASA
jgi:hypothetical protein